MPSSSTKPLALPDYATTLLLAAKPLLAQFFDFKHLTIGGGTTLSARWDHRPSFDIDLFTTNFEAANQPYRELSRLQDSIASQPGNLQHFCSLDRGEILFPDRGSVSWLHAPRITTPGFSGQFEPHTGIAFDTNEEILAKKLYFRIYASYDYLPRDLYDVAWAITHEPAATMETATRILSPRDRALLGNSFVHLPADTMQGKGRNQLIDPKDPDLARHAIAIIRDYFQRTPFVTPNR